MKFTQLFTSFLLLSVFNSEMPIVNAQNRGDDNLRFGYEIMDAQDAAFGTLYNVVIGDDIDVCWTYTQILGWNFVDALKFFFEFKWELAIINVGLVIHKSPIVYYECLLILHDLTYIDTMFSLFNAGPFTFNLNMQIIENLMFNLGDIMYNQGLAKETLVKRDYAAFGETVARMVSDIFYINPVDEDVWSDVNSLIIESDSSSKKVPSSFYNVLNVQASNDLQPFNKGVNTLKKVGHIIDSVAAHQEPRIRDEQARTKRDKHDKIMNMESYKEEDIKGKGIAETMSEWSAKYQRKVQIKNAHTQEQQSIDELEAVLRELDEL